MRMVTFVERIAPRDRTRFWNGYRSLLEDPSDCVADAVAYTLAVDYFEGPIADDAWRKTTRLLSAAGLVAGGGSSGLVVAFRSRRR